MAQLLITTQYCENYGSPDEPYWKFKGGSEYKIPFNCDADYEWAEVYAERLIDQYRNEIEMSNPMCEEYILGWEIVADDYLTQYELSQLQYDGYIQFPAKTLGETIHG